MKKVPANTKKRIFNSAVIAMYALFALALNYQFRLDDSTAVRVVVEEYVEKFKKLPSGFQDLYQLEEERTTIMSRARHYIDELHCERSPRGGIIVRQRFRQLYVLTTSFEDTLPDPVETRR
jgi:hypothetical protein